MGCICVCRCDLEDHDRAWCCNARVGMVRHPHYLLTDAELFYAMNVCRCAHEDLQKERGAVMEEWRMKICAELSQHNIL